MSQPPTTRDRLVHTALKLFAEKGYGSTSVADVRHTAGIHSGSLYHFFPGKQELLLAVLGTYHAGIGPMLLEPAWRGITDPVEKIFALLARYRAALAQTECTYGCPIGSLALELHEPDPPVRQLLARNFDGWVAAVESCLDEAADRLPARLDRRRLAQFVLSVMEGAVMQARTHRDIRYFDACIAQLRDHFDMLLGAVSRPKRAARKPQADRTRKKRKAK